MYFMLRQQNTAAAVYTSIKYLYTLPTDNELCHLHSWKLEESARSKKILPMTLCNKSMNWKCAGFGLKN